jgi:hypothetical protein
MQNAVLQLPEKTLLSESLLFDKIMDYADVLNVLPGRLKKNVVILIDLRDATHHHYHLRVGADCGLVCVIEAWED